MTNAAARNQVFSKMEAQRFSAQYSARPLAYLSHGARFERMVARLIVAKKDQRMQAAAAIAKMARRIVDEMPI